MTTLAEVMTARAAWVVPDVIDAEAAARLRAGFDAAGYQRYRLIDRGSYDYLEAVDAPAILDTLAALAARVSDRSLVVVGARVLRLHAGDYLLAHHDRIDSAPRVEVVLDASAVAIPGAEVHYRNRGAVFHRWSSQPGAAGIVERGPALACNHTYVSRRWPDAAIVRLVVSLADR
jgi:hypothetical protein